MNVQNIPKLQESYVGSVEYYYGNANFQLRRQEAMMDSAALLLHMVGSPNGMGGGQENVHRKV